MNPELQRAITDLVNMLNTGTKGAGGILQSVGSEAWRIAIRQVQLEAIFGLLVWSIIGISIIMIGRFIVLPQLNVKRELLAEAQDKLNEARKCGVHSLIFDAERQLDKADDLVCSRLGIYWILNFCGWIIVLISISTSAIDLLNPEYKAGKNVIEIANGTCK